MAPGINFKKPPKRQPRLQANSKGLMTSWQQERTPKGGPDLGYMLYKLCLLQLERPQRTTTDVQLPGWQHAGSTWHEPLATVNERCAGVAVPALGPPPSKIQMIRFRQAPRPPAAVVRPLDAPRRSASKIRLALYEGAYKREGGSHENRATRVALL